ncbi:choice-of-anchor A domain-containing protein [Agromyces sp. 3263]|uniref:collagen-binding domain-containing protein n=1 Tax=Agromyces sp. 3263 TaxID=2817750 RepID=UPI00285C63DE|nr:collagen-binding domain-containing protein [Agromyces sp. 3263]MDR6905706.1 choice-of-anchor A domain-containing protein [Agromyces sp. 3263]
MAAFAGAAVLLPGAAVAAPGDTIGPINPVAQPLGSHAANSGFLVFVEGDVELNADEAEGTLALGGDLSFQTPYNIAAGSVPPGTFIAPGDTSPTYLYVGGGVAFPDDAGVVLKVLNNGFTKIADTTTYDAFDTDQNNTVGPHHVVPPGGSYETQPRIEGTITQTPTSIETPVPADLIDVDGAFALYRDTTTTLSRCAPTIDFANRDDGAPLTPPYAEGTAARLTLVPGETNVVTLAAADLDALAEITFPDGGPSPDTPLLVNVTGTAFSGTIPNLAGLSGANAPFILWNFPEATSVTVTGGATLEGTIYAPNADVNWQVTQNIEGNVIAASFIHGQPAATPVGSPREVHNFPFAAELTCLESGDSIPPDPTDPPTDPSTPPGPTNPDQALPATGTDAFPGMVAAAALAAAGAAATAIGSRRRA